MYGLWVVNEDYSVSLPACQGGLLEKGLRLSAYQGLCPFDEAAAGGRRRETLITPNGPVVRRLPRRYAMIPECYDRRSLLAHCP